MASTAIEGRPHSAAPAVASAIDHLAGKPSGLIGSQGQRASRAFPLRALPFPRPFVVSARNSTGGRGVFPRRRIPVIFAHEEGAALVAPPQTAFENRP